MTPAILILSIVFCHRKQAGTPPGVGDWPSEISIETQVAAKCDGLLLSDPCLRSAATSFGSRGFARLSGSWEISVSLDFSFFLSRKRTRRKYYIPGNTEIEVNEVTSGMRCYFTFPFILY